MPGKRVTNKTPLQKRLRFQWAGIGANGASLSGELVAASEVRARIELRRQGITPTRVDRSRRRTTRLPAKTIAFLLRQLATLIRTGVPILAALDIIARSQEKPEATRLLLQIRADLQTGASLATALARHPDNFDDLTCTLVAAGEQSGLLDVMLARIADYQEKMLAIRGKLRGALTYPVAILAVALIVTVLMLAVVVPAFENSFSSFGAALPLPTRIIIDGSAAIRDYGFVSLVPDCHCADFACRLFADRDRNRTGRCGDPLRFGSSARYCGTGSLWTPAVCRACVVDRYAFAGQRTECTASLCQR